MVQTLTASEQNQLKLILQQWPLLISVNASLREVGGKLFIVGGAVRNIVLGLPVADVDVEVFNLSLAQLQTVLARFGPVDYVGKSFGVLRIKGFAIDWALPRKDQGGRHPHVDLIPNLSLEDALRRRDITMNAMAIDLEQYELHDPFQGRDDIAHRRLRTPDPLFFVQDPLRFYRVMQFIGRFQMLPDTTLHDICSSINLTGVSIERIGAEFDKLMLLSPAPSWGLRWLYTVGRLMHLLPELGATMGILQDISWHPEGDVFEHTMQAVDAAAQQKCPSSVDRRTVIYAALCHDLGKAVTTNICEGRIRSKGHDEAGVPLARALLHRIMRERTLIKRVAILVRYHMMPGQLVIQRAHAAAYKRLAVRIAPLSLRALALLAYADKSARNPLRGTPLSVAQPDIDAFIAYAQQYGVLDHPETPVLSGADLIPYVAPGPAIGKLLQHAYDIQINRSVRDKAELLRRVLGL